ncbi:hypothetical protein AV530_016938 [Patagioenas fasciata monilis]|uniref:ARHGAP20 PH domain-containing protein n=1 Tax=Patagioenas fasciata monilis TaxID=372326 RepID=A0A1V4J4D4_PATFA|nr:hypothetical protein AV530_016938 [Patagioenas fasciata monilis]
MQMTRDDPELGQQLMPILELPEPPLQQHVRVTQGHVTRKRDLLLFSDTLVIAKSQRGSALHPQLCLALGQLQVLSSAKGAAGDATEEEEGRHTNLLVLVWPCGSCVITFHCRAVKELWVSALLGPAGGVERARVTQMPSFKLMLKELRAHNAAMGLHTSNLERLVKSQAKVSITWGAILAILTCHIWHWGPFLLQGCLDLLALLQEHGPSTEEIFLLPASKHASQEIREALNSGAEVQLQSQPCVPPGHHPEGEPS